MNASATRDAYGTLIEPTTLKIQRLLPGPVERIWAYLTDSELRRKWLASGAMEMKVGAPVELVWRNDELNDPPSKRPADFPEENRMQSRITELVPLRKLAIAWNNSGDVSFELEPKGEKVLLTTAPSNLGSSGSLLDDQPFKDALAAADVPDDVTWLAYADVPRLSPLIQAFSALLGSGQQAPNLKLLDKLGTLVAYGARTGSTSRLVVRLTHA